MNTKKLIQNQSTKDDAITQKIPLACVDEIAATEFMEHQRWGMSPCCPLCGGFEVYKMMDASGKQRQVKFRWRCRDCKGQYTVRKGTVLEDSAIPLIHWCFAFWRAATSKKGVSALEIHRQRGLSYKSSLFLLHRIRHAMTDTSKPQLGGAGVAVEADETYFGNKKGVARRPGTGHKHAIFALVERNAGVRSFHVPNVTAKTLRPILEKHVAKTSDLMTDDAAVYNKVGKPFARHEVVNHSKGEYVRGDATTNTVEGYFSILKRGLHGIYHNVSEHHLHRYLSEFDFRYSHRNLSDGQRTSLAIKQAQGKRLMYREPIEKNLD
ncbi:MAG: IS1595 family transposase [Pseudomonadota bacterium]